MKKMPDLSVKHPNADRRGLGMRDWFRSFAHEFERRTGVEVVRSDFRDVVTKYYSRDVTPTEGVNEDIENYGLHEI